MAAELAASIVAAASTLHEQHTERKIVRVIEDDSLLHLLSTFGQDVKERLLESKDIPRELWLVWHEKESRPDSESWTWPVRPSLEEPRFHDGPFWSRSASDPPSRPLQEMRVPLAELLAETRWTIEREIKPAADVSYLVLARTAPRPRPGPPAGGV